MTTYYWSYSGDKIEYTFPAAVAGTFRAMATGDGDAGYEDTGDGTEQIGTVVVSASNVTQTLRIELANAVGNDLRSSKVCATLYDRDRQVLKTFATAPAEVEVVLARFQVVFLVISTASRL